jgi:mannose-6-phosphate isomerase
MPADLSNWFESMLYPLTFYPVFKERIWGGRNLERLFGKPLPQGASIGESWEISDRPDAVSVIANGPLMEKDLRWLMEQAGPDLLGDAAALDGRFPLLVKILDAQDKLSLQVHPPAALAKRLGGQTKAEMWYVVDAKPGAELFVGLKRGTTRDEFESRIREGSVEACFHRIAVRRGDAMFLPSGRVHAIGAGIVIFEVQQNSDTTYRVHDWNRVDDRGRPRELHIRESLTSIDFQDFQPELIKAPEASGQDSCRTLVNNALFQVAERAFEPGIWTEKTSDRPVVLGVVSGRLALEGDGIRIELRPGGFCLIPANVPQLRLDCATQVQVLWTVPG